MMSRRRCVSAASLPVDTAFPRRSPLFPGVTPPGRLPWTTAAHKCRHRGWRHTCPRRRRRRRRRRLQTRLPGIRRRGRQLRRRGGQQLRRRRLVRPLRAPAPWPLLPRGWLAVVARGRHSRGGVMPHRLWGHAVAVISLAAAGGCHLFGCCHRSNRMPDLARLWKGRQKAKERRCFTW